MEDSTDRRGFIKKLVAGITAIMVIGSGGAAALWWWWGRSPRPLFRKFARVRELPINQPKLVSIADSSTPAGPTARQISVWLVRRDENAVDAYSIICPHAGGRLRCGEGQFVCPKHGARFDLLGHRLKTGINDRPNPAPRDMDRLPAQCVTDDGDGLVVEVKYQEFLTGTPKQLPAP
jgi:Rieske Fe-S protein